MILTIDFETRSVNDLRKSNPFVYAEHPSTQIMCLALKVDDAVPYLWVPGDVLPLYGGEELMLSTVGDLNLIEGFFVERLIDDADIIEAHNLTFEVALWAYIMHKRYGFPDLREEPYFSKLRCSASVAAQHALPRALGRVCKALGTEHQKDNEGHKLMLKMCKPRTPRKAEREANPDWGSRVWWHEAPEDLLRQAKYCAQDVNTEYAVSQRLGELPASELEVWRLDQRANWKGVTLDRDMVDKMILLRDEYVDGVAKEFKALVGVNVSQVTAFAGWLQDKLGVPVPSVDVAALERMLADPSVAPDVHRALELRQAYAKTSLRKLDAGLAKLSGDGRMRSTLLYHGASTGRWTGKGMQLQNLPSRDLISDIPLCIDMIKGGIDLETLAVFQPDVQKALASCIRGTLTAGAGETLYCADFSSIEGRVLAWLAGDDHIIKSYREGLDQYKIAATVVYGVQYEDVTKAQRQVGKIPELGGGYGGGWRAYAGFAQKAKLIPPPEVLENLCEADYYDWWIKPENREDAERFSDEDAAYCCWFSPIVKAWRANRPGTTALWAGLNTAAINAVGYPGQIFSYAGIKFGVSKGFLQCLLLSGRKLYYFSPKIYRENGKPGLTYMGTNAKLGGAWTRQRTYGGKLCENVVQALARDLMAEAGVRIDKADLGLDLLFTVHDELIEEGREGILTLTEFEDLMAESPDWAAGCPIEAKGWIGFNYRK